MKNKFLFLLGTLAGVGVFFLSCSTSIPVTVTHPPRMDTSGIERLAVLDFQGSEDQQELAGALTRLFKEKISGTGKFQMVDSSAYSQNEGSVDGVFTGEIISYTVKDTSRFTMLLTEFYNRSVELTFTYTLIRARDNVTIGQRSISCTNWDGDKTDPKTLQPGHTLAAEAAKYVLRNFNQELLPWTIKEELTLDKETSKDKAVKNRMKDAEKLVKAGSIKAAYEAYAGIYGETKSLAAGYNQAILAQPLESLEAAIALMQRLVNDTGYTKASAELTRLRGFLSESERAAANTAGISQQKIAIQRASKGLTDALPPGSRVSLLNVSGSDKDLVDTVIRETTNSLVATGNITVLDRDNLNLINAEQQYQLSGEVSDDSMVGIGKMLGVDTIVTFSITGTGHQRKLTVKSLRVETGQVLYNESTEI